MNKPTQIGCVQDHLFCKECLDKYYENNTIKSCPVCREEGLAKGQLRLSRSTERLLNLLQVSCPLQHKQNELDFYHLYECKWEGQFENLSKHIDENCPLKIIACQDCTEKMQRGQLRVHNDVCGDKLLDCKLGCSLVNILYIYILFSHDYNFMI